MRLVVVALPLLLGLLLAACSGGDGTDGTGSTGGDAPTLTRVQAEVFDVGCNVASCHGAAGKAGALILEDGVSHAQLVGVAADNPKAASEGLVRVAPGDPDASFLVRKCQAGLAADYGQVMPQGNPDGLEAARLQLVRDWIEAGALDD